MRMADEAVAGTSPMPEHRRTRQKMAIVARTGLLMECFAEILSSRFPDYQIIAYDSLEDMPPDIMAGIRLALVHDPDLSRIERFAAHFKAGAPQGSIGVIIDGLAETEYPALQHLMEGQRISGVLPLSLNLEVFLAGIELLAKGGEHFPSMLLRRSQPANDSGVVMKRPRGDNGPALEEAGRIRLTIREVEILDLVCRGTQNKRIAGALQLSENTVKAHIRNIYKKMQVRNRTEAASQHFSGQTKRGQLALSY